MALKAVELPIGYECASLPNSVIWNPNFKEKHRCPSTCAKQGGAAAEKNLERVIYAVSGFLVHLSFSDVLVENDTGSNILINLLQGTSTSFRNLGVDEDQGNHTDSGEHEEGSG